MTAPAQAANQQPPLIRQQVATSQQLQKSQLGQLGHQLGSAPPKLPLLAEVSNRIVSNIGSAVDAHTKLRQRIDEILGSEPPHGSQPSSGTGMAPPATQAGSLLQQCDTLEDALKELHHQIARLGAI